MTQRGGSATAWSQPRATQIVAHPITPAKSRSKHLPSEDRAVGTPLSAEAINRLDTTPRSLILNPRLCSGPIGMSS
jgi:hypothetical protein